MSEPLEITYTKEEKVGDVIVTEIIKFKFDPPKDVNAVFLKAVVRDLRDGLKNE